VKPSILSTTRLTLRPFTLADVNALHRLWNEPGVRKYLWDDEPVSKGRVESIIETSQSIFETEGSGLWGVFPVAEHGLIGFAGFWKFHDPPVLELLYGIAPDYWNCGLATEAANAILKYGFEELPLDRIEASTDAANEASTRVMQRLGMTFWKRELTNGLDTIYYAISREAFEAKHS
jgi:[ribosomal protein S5]-alanine N-acetyltransferase